MAQTSKYYHHGKSPAAWTGTIMAAIGFVFAAIGSVLGPNWPIVVVGTAIVVVALLTTMVMKAMGYGQP